MTDRQPTSVGEDFPHQQERLRELMQEYRDLGPAGTFGLMMLQQVAKRADEAMASGNVVRILSSYQEMKECK